MIIVNHHQEKDWHAKITSADEQKIEASLKAEKFKDVKAPGKPPYKVEYRFGKDRCFGGEVAGIESDDVVVAVRSVINRQTYKWERDEVVAYTRQS